jgi:hypothetical protein
MSQTGVLGDTAPRVRVIIESGDSGSYGPVDLTDGPQLTQSSDHTTRVIGGLALMIALVLVLLMIADGQRAAISTAAEEDATPSTTGEPTASSPPPNSIAALRAANNGQLVPWPTSPNDREPRVMGWPAQPIGTDLAMGTIVYVNTIGRATILDLGGGFQSEVDVSPTRLSETFLLERGRVVTNVSGSSLPKATDAAIEIQVQQDAYGTAGAQSGTMLSIRTPAARLLDGRGLDALTTLFGSSDLDEERWTTFVVGDTGEEAFRLPTPDPTTAVWIIESS